MNKSYGERFNQAIQNLVKALKDKECPLPETLENLMRIPISSLDKYPLAIRRIIRALWSDIEIYLNCFCRFEDVNEEYLFQGIAILEQLESELYEL